MATLAANGGADSIATLTDADGGTVTPESVLGALRDMVESAQPGDQLLFSFSGQAGEQSGGDSNAIQLGDGQTITAGQIEEIIGSLPEGAQLTMAFDGSSTGTTFDFDPASSGSAGNVVFLSSPVLESPPAGDEAGSPFTLALLRVMSQNDHVTFMDAAAGIDAELGLTVPSTVVASSHTEELYGTIFASDPALESATDEAATIAPMNATRTDQNHDGIVDKVVIKSLFPDTTATAYDTDANGKVDQVHLQTPHTYAIGLDENMTGKVESLTVMDYKTGNSVIMLDMNEDGVVDEWRKLDWDDNILDFGRGDGASMTVPVGVYRIDDGFALMQQNWQA
ncbi:hypothetical protein H9P43_009157 [Blastocladiella emersonii ATCC 22665]|nr:hypothetical protein H9P43_009157 [Blastocladiella emersonii ATCC 22665]